MEPFDKRGDFEQAISIVFDGAETTPDPRVWDKIDAELTKDKSSGYRRRLFFFQLVAAASLIFAATITLFQVLKRDDVVTKPVTEQTEVQEKAPVIENVEEGIEEQQQLAIKPKDTRDSEELIAVQPRQENIDNQDTDKLQITRQLTKTTGIPGEDETGQVLNIETDELATPDEEVYRSDIIFIQHNDYNVLTGLTSYEPLFAPVWVKKVDEEKSDLWASAGFSAGSYNPSSGGGFGLGLAASADEAATPASELGDQLNFIHSDEQSGRAIGGGIGFGGRISRKWILESGLNYLHSEIDGVSNSYVESDGRSYTLFHESAYEGDIKNTSLYGVTTSYDFVTVPFRAGYILVDRKFGWVINGGFGSNILLDNALTSDLGQFERVDYTVSDSPYRRLSWSGIIGTEVYFNLTDDYQLMVVPQYNFGITEITKQESSFNIIPNSFNLGIRFRYLLK